MNHRGVGARGQASAPLQTLLRDEAKPNVAANRLGVVRVALRAVRLGTTHENPTNLGRTKSETACHGAGSPGRVRTDGHHRTRPSARPVIDGTPIEADVRVSMDLITASGSGKNGTNNLWQSVEAPRPEGGWTMGGVRALRPGGS